MELPKKFTKEECSPEPSLQDRPLIVDLDGTLIHTDILHESSLRLLRDRPYLLLAIPFWLSKGKATLKKKLLSYINFDIASLPFNLELIEWLKLQKKLGRTLILCTASDEAIAHAIANHLQIFDEVLASDGEINLAGKHKANYLVEKYGKYGFDYVGNSTVDLAIWEKSKRGIVVSKSQKLAIQAKLITDVETVFTGAKSNLKTWVKVFRLHQWIKNLLIFIPVFAAHKSFTNILAFNLFLAFLSFGLCASSVYITNDLMDLESDRLHPRKRFRPFASGAVPVWHGVLFAPALLTVSLMIGAYVGGNFLSWLLVYFGLTCAYSWGLKRLVLLDCLILAILYTLRIIAGASAAMVPLSFWLLAFSIFLFLSLAFIKRYAELRPLSNQTEENVHGRGYWAADAPLIQQIGVTSGFMAVLVLALYLNSEQVTSLYQTPEIIWGAIPIILFWISWMWLKADRGLMHDDPIIFAIKDRVSIFIGALLITIFIMATV